MHIGSERSKKMFNYGEEEQEVLQGIFGPGQSFGEPALLGRFPYPACAQATEDTEQYRAFRTNYSNVCWPKTPQ
jgi:CRP-like cAMP-binding protein